MAGGLSVLDVVVEGDSIRLLVHKSKTDQFGKGDQCCFGEGAWPGIVPGGSAPGVVSDTASCGRPSSTSQGWVALV